MNNYKWTPLALALAMSASLSHATSSTTDVDIDNDGLIEISTLQELDLMRYDPSGASLNGDSTGCPATGCNGYELVADLDFDTNGNGVADAGDLFWNNGEGWEPVGQSSSRFTADFNGNNHTISRMMINNTSLSYSGFIGYAEGSSITDLNIIEANVRGSGPGILTGRSKNGTVSNVTVDGEVASEYNYAGTLIGTAVTMVIEDIEATGDVEYLDYAGSLRAVGGIVGIAIETSLSRVKYSGDLDSGDASFAGGIIGFSQGNNEVIDALVLNASLSAYSIAGGIVGDSWGVVDISNSLFIGTLAGSYETAPIVADGYNNGDQITVSSSYWDADVSGIYTSTYGNSRTTSELKCPTMPDDAICDASLYSGWDSTIWDFGSSSEYPALR